MNDYRPHTGDTYFCVNPDGFIDAFQWDDDVMDLTYYYAGNCYRTHEDAIANRRTLIGRLKMNYGMEDEE